jgi:hypothetical protein
MTTAADWTWLILAAILIVVGIELAFWLGIELWDTLKRRLL